MSSYEQPDPAVAEPSADLPPNSYLNRDLSWLAFNYRVLQEAVDARNPLLERVRFLGIFGTNLDEFFMKRVGLLLRLRESTPLSPTFEGLMPERQLRLVREEIEKLLLQQRDCFENLLRPALAENNIHLLGWDDLSPEDREEADTYFRSNVFPILTPLAVDPGHPFPFISNLSVSLAVVLQHPDRPEHVFARVKIPEMLPNWIRLRNAGSSSGGQFRFFSLYDLIRNNLNHLFRDMVIVDATLFRITRSAAAENLEDEDPEDLRESVQQELHLRRFAPVVRMEHDADVNTEVLALLMSELDLQASDVYAVPLALRFVDLSPVVDLKLAKLTFAPWSPCLPSALTDNDADFFSLMRKGDMLVHHPYESFSASVERFVSDAADDPKVLAIKMTLYRTGDESPFIRTLIRAAESGKQVVCLVELKARFDEQRNIMLTRALEKAGVHVVYGVVGLKTHSKVTLIVRNEPDGLRSYAHIATGNYHAQTARLYTDLGLFTASPEVTGDLIELFNFLTGRSVKRDYKKLLIAPTNMRRQFLELIDREIAHAAAGRPARVIAKMNSLEDRKIIARLIAASQAGVDIDLIIRGLCCLAPGVPGLTDRIRVISVIGRFLEHSRIFYFQNGQTDPLAGDFYMGSTDWMSRNLNNRVEVVVPVSSRPLREQMWELLQICLNDQRQVWDMQPDGRYVQRKPATPDAPGTHQIMMDLTRNRCGVAGAKK
ncbi:MAG TPA: polyphosphate kinase 1 [Tepidisphaeraceae bacterium]|jgi:polyphosphate kinase|nr:polyphosphate kinase 1 [Tepidisphaeraceae bacterium]